MRLTLITGPVEEPVTLDEAKAHLRVETTEEDGLITGLISAARQHAEAFTGRAFVTQTWEARLDAFPCEGQPLVLPLAPLQAVASIQYVDPSGATQTWPSSSYAVDAPAGDDAPPGRIIPAYGVPYPSTRSVPNAVTVRFTAGYGGAAAVPEAIKRALLLIVGQLYEHRQLEVAGTVVGRIGFTAESLLWPYRLLRV